MMVRPSAVPRVAAVAAVMAMPQARGCRDRAAVLPRARMPAMTSSGIAASGKLMAKCTAEAPAKAAASAAISSPVALLTVWCGREAGSAGVMTWSPDWCRGVRLVVPVVNRCCADPAAAAAGSGCYRLRGVDGRAGAGRVALARPSPGRVRAGLLTWVPALRTWSRLTPRRAPSQASGAVAFGRGGQFPGPVGRHRPPRNSKCSSSSGTPSRATRSPAAFRDRVTRIAGPYDRSARLHGPEGLGGGHAGGAQRGQEPGGCADEDGGADAAAQGEGGYDDGPALGRGVDGGGQRADGDAGGAVEEAEQDGLGQELDADVAFGGAEGAAQPYLGAAFEDGDDHDVGHPDGADQQRDRAEAEEQAVEGALRVGLGDEGGGGLADADLAGVFGVGSRRQQRLDGADLAGCGADVDGGGVTAEVQVVLGGGEPDQDRGVETGGEDGGFEDPGQVEPLAAEPDPLAGPDAVDAEALGGHGAEHGDWFVGGGGVEVVAPGDAGADGSGQAEAGCLDGQAVGVDGGDQRAAVDRGIDRPAVLDGGDRVHPGDHGRGGFGQFGGAAEHVLPVGDGEQVGAEPADLGEQPGRGRG